jgi:hypothetical protein
MRHGFSEWLSNVPQQMNEALKSASEWLADGQPAPKASPRGGRKQAPVFHEATKSTTPESLEAVLQDANQRSVALREVIRKAFGDRMPSDLELDPLLPLAATPKSFTLLAELFSLLSRKGCPCSADLLAGWGSMASSNRLLASLELLVDLVAPRDDEAWGQLYTLLHASWGRPAFERIFQLADGLAPMKRALSLESLELLAQSLRDASACECFLQAIRSFRASDKLSWDELDAVVVKFAKDEESSATIGEIGTILAQRGREGYRSGDLDFIFSELSTRTAVKRYLQAFKILDEYQIRFDEFDAFVTSFARHSEDIEWLSEAVLGLQEAGRVVTRLTLVQLREWAPTTAALKRYVRGVRAFVDSGLSGEQIDQFLLPHMESEAEAAVASMIGELGGRLFDGTFTLERVETLMEALPERAAVKRYEQAVLLMREAGLRPSDIEVLAPEFARTADDAIWLEAFVRNSAEMSRAVERLELFHIRERCPEVTHIYRYFRLRKLFDEFTQISQAEFEDLAFDALLDEEQSLGYLMETLTEWGRQHECTAADVRRLMEAFPGRAGVQRYKTAIQNFQGSWVGLDYLAIALATTEHRASIMAMVGKSLGARQLNDVDRNPALNQMIEQVIAKAEKGSVPE